jgi:gluconokinase
VIVVVTGAAGSGKTTIGRALSDTLGWRFIDGDDYHPPASIAKMRSGIPLTEADRAPWLASLRREMAAAIGRRAPLVVACSALRESYRRTLRGDLPTVRFVLLDADDGTLRRRLETRTGHFAGPSLVPTQLATLEPPAGWDVLIVDATRAPAQIVERIRYEFGV